MNSSSDNQINGDGLYLVDQDVFSFTDQDNQNSFDYNLVPLEPFNGSQIEVGNNPVEYYYNSDLAYLSMEDFNF